MPNNTSPSPRTAGKAAIAISAAIAFIVLSIFVGLNLQHAKTLRQEQSGQVDPSNAPKTDRDLGSSPAPQRVP